MDAIINHSGLYAGTLACWVHWPFLGACLGSLISTSVYRGRGESAGWSHWLSGVETPGDEYQVHKVPRQEVLRCGRVLVRQQGVRDPAQWGSGWNGHTMGLFILVMCFVAVFSMPAQHIAGTPGHSPHGPELSVGFAPGDTSLPRVVPGFGSLPRV